MDKFCYVFYVTHRYTVGIDSDGEPICDIKEMGVYTTRRLALEAVGRFAGLPGFTEYPDGFLIARERCYLDSATDKTALRTLYSPYHERYLPEPDCDDVTRGAFFDTAAEAEAVLRVWKARPALAGQEDGFAVIEYTVNQDMRLWNEGFSR